MNAANQVSGLVICLVMVYLILSMLDASPSFIPPGPRQNPRTFLPGYLSQSSTNTRSFVSRYADAAPNSTGEANASCLIFNALPKCGSRTLLSLAVMGDGYSAGRLSVDSNLTLLPPEMSSEEKFAKRFVSEHLRYVNDPSFVYTHARFVDVSETLGKPSVKYISLIREPFNRLVSTYYYRRNRDRTELTEKEKKWRSTLTNLSSDTFDECVGHRRAECTGRFVGMAIIAHFCGPDPKCNTNVTWALERAKRNVESHFETVGIMEDYTSFVEVVECLFPSHFRGALGNYRRMETNTMKTKGKVKPTKETQELMNHKLRHDIEFYNFVKQRFYAQKRRLCPCHER